MDLVIFTVLLMALVWSHYKLNKTKDYEKRN
jgi:hypothetical protein